MVLRRTFGGSLSVCCLFSASYTISALYSPPGSSSSPKNKPPVLSCRERTPHFHLSWKVRQWIYKKHDCFLNRLSNNASDLTLSHLHPSFRVHLTPNSSPFLGFCGPTACGLSADGHSHQDSDSCLSYVTFLLPNFHCCHPSFCFTHYSVGLCHHVTRLLSLLWALRGPSNLPCLVGV